MPEHGRDARLIAWARDFARDLHHAVRVFQRAPGFAVVAALTLAIGIGANTAVFSLVHGLLIAQLPVREPDRLIAVSHNSLERRSGAGLPYDFVRAPARHRARAGRHPACRTNNAPA
jgi:hypothetical protein